MEWHQKETELTEQLVLLCWFDLIYLRDNFLALKDGRPHIAKWFIARYHRQRIRNVRRKNGHVMYGTQWFSSKNRKEKKGKESAGILRAIQNLIKSA